MNAMAFNECRIPVVASVGRLRVTLHNMNVTAYEKVHHPITLVMLKTQETFLVFLTIPML